MNELRFALARDFQREARRTAHRTPGLHHLLPVPIRERLVLLAKVDGAEATTIIRILPVSRDDATLESAAMQEAIAIMKRSLVESYWHLPEKHGWRQHRNTKVEQALGQLLWADVAVALIGDGTLPSVSQIPLRRRLILYLLIVERMKWCDTMRLIRCTNWELRQAIFDGLRAVGGI